MVRSEKFNIERGEEHRFGAMGVEIGSADERARRPVRPTSPNPPVLATATLLWRPWATALIRPAHQVRSP